MLRPTISKLSENKYSKNIQFMPIRNSTLNTLTSAHPEKEYFRMGTVTYPKTLRGLPAFIWAARRARAGFEWEKNDI